MRGYCLENRPPLADECGLKWPLETGWFLDHTDGVETGFTEDKNLALLQCMLLP